VLIALRRGSLARKEIDRLCSPATMVEDRFDWLVANGFLERRHSGYTLTKTGQILVVVFGRLRRFFRLERTVGSGNGAAG
jgi:predicted transcriptional regulator